ncbi:MAG: hypothetical protein ACK5WS_07160 [Alphaproteobacteria bacterium]|jgi:glutathione synthase|nr:hypothetical protein [Candidatus Jidaibacter sp.]
MIGIQTDSLESLNFESDTSLLLASEIASRGYKLFFFCPNDIYFAGETISAHGHIVDLDYANHKYQASPHIADLLDLKLVLVRQNPPFDLGYLHNTYMLDILESKIPFFNKPSAIRNTPEKLSALRFPNYIPDTLLTNQASLVMSFLQKHKKIVLKAPYGFGGNEVKVAELNSAANINQFMQEHGFVIAQEFLDEIKDGDKRVFIVARDILGAIRRVPQAHGFLSNLGHGATAHKTSLSPKELEICENVSDFLRAQDIFFAGVDLIGEKLIEINVTSPTAVKAYNALYDSALEKTIVDMMQLNEKNG